MIKFTSTEYENLLREFEVIEKGAENMLQKAERSFQAVGNALNSIKSFILGYTFKDIAEEILFFKEIKPRFLKEQIYYKELQEIEGHRPFGDNEMLIGYYHHVLERISIYFSRNQYLHNYYLLGKTVHDEEFFLRIGNDAIADTAIDQRFCTAYSHKLSKLMAFEMVRAYLQKSIYQLERPGEQPYPIPQVVQKYQWTDSKVALIELAYALQSKGSVNNGKLLVKQMIDIFEQLFDIDLGNYSAVFQQNIRIRKRSSRTLYIDQLKEYLERRMDDADEYPIMRM
jgi:hypothetical protein